MANAKPTCKILLREREGDRGGSPWFAFLFRGDNTGAGKGLPICRDGRSGMRAFSRKDKISEIVCYGDVKNVPTEGFRREDLSGMGRKRVFQSASERGKGSVHHRDPAAEHYGAASHGACAQQFHSGQHYSF